MGLSSLLHKAVTSTPSAPAAFLASNSLLPQLESFTSTLPTTYTTEAIKRYFLTAPALHPAIATATALSVLVWLLGEVTGNVSQVDRLWTVLPLLYSGHFAFNAAQNGVYDNRLLLVFGLQCLWSIRLTTNTYRRGFLNPKSEDYRWEIVRRNIPTWAFKLLNLVFIAFIQNYLLLIAELPVYLLLQQHLTALSPSPPLGPADYGLAAVFVGLLTIEMIADNQQQKYQNFKIAVNQGKTVAKTREEKGAMKRGFVTGGLWAWSRHPNFACEQATWYILYLFTVLPFLPHHTELSTLFPPAPTHVSGDFNDIPHFLAHLKDTVTKSEGVLWNYSVLSPILMTALFLGSTTLTEIISSNKYPLYKAYQRRVAMFIPSDTIWKGNWLRLLGKKSATDAQVWGDAGTVNGHKRGKSQ